MQRYTNAERRYFIDEFNKSGMTQLAFSKKHNITKSSLSYWLRKLKTSSEFVCVTEKIIPGICEYSTITLTINDTVKIELSDSYNELLLKRILMTLGVTI